MECFLRVIKNTCQIICEYIFDILIFNVLFALSFKQCFLSLLILQALIPDFLDDSNTFSNNKYFNFLVICLLNIIKIFISIFLSSYLLSIPILSICLMHIIVIATYILSGMIEYLISN